MKLTAPISVVIPARSVGAQLDATLERLMACNPLPSEVILHIDGGHECLSRPAMKLSIPLRILQAAQQRGPGGGRDAGIRAASYDLVASFDDDSWPLDEDYFAKATALMTAFPQAAVLSPAVFLAETPLAPSLAEVKEVRCFEGSASITRKSHYLKLPGYVPVPQAYGVEEADLSLQAHSAGLQILASPWLRAWHDRPRADHLHAERAWMQNEVLLGYLRFPSLAQPWAWWRALRRAWRMRHALGYRQCLHALLSCLPHCAQYRHWQGRVTWSALWRHLHHQSQRWLIRSEDTGLSVSKAPKARRIIFAQYTNPAVYPPLEHATKILSRRGWEVECLGIHGRLGQVMDWPMRDRIRIKRLPWCEPGIQQKLHYLGFALWVLWRAYHSKAEWVYLSDQLATPITPWLRRFTRARIAYHEHDSPPHEGYASGWFIEHVLKTRLQTARDCDVLVLPNQERLRTLVSAAGGQPRGKSFTVWNCPSLDEVGPARDPMLPNHELEVLYHGSIGSSGFPQWVLNGIMQVSPPVRMTLVGYELPGAIGWTDKLAERANEGGFAGRFHRHEAMARWQLLHFCRTKDVGLGVLSIDTSNINLRFLAGASNKPFDYLAQGVVPIVPDLLEWRTLMVDRGCAVACPPDNAAALAEVIEHLATCPDDVRAMGEIGRQLVLTEWNYESQFAGVLAHLETDP